MPQTPLANVRLIATDLDGTLLDPDGRVTPRTAAAVRAAREAGVLVVPVTGRPPQAVWHIIQTAGLGPLGVCCNGAAIVDLDERVVLQVDPLVAATAARLVDLVRAAEPDVRLACDDLDVFTHERDFFDVPAAWDEEMRVVSDLRPVVAASGCVKLIGRVPGLTATQLIARLEDEIADEGHVTTSGLDWVDIGAPGVSKALAVQRVCGMLGVAVDEVVAIGDNHNDLSVLGWAGQAMAPANAVAEVRAVADRLLPSNADGGVATLLEELVMTRCG
ncbi:MAG: HAD-IIB family hydrolase [Acidimicrobiaceae bacterium]|nr:HAD-IIB family hydrolase [Acidimicrobiaceae bacterium]